MVSMDCVLHLISLQTGVTTDEFLRPLILISSRSPPYLLKGRPHGWVHRPHSLNKDQLTGHEWDLVLLVEDELPATTKRFIDAQISINVSIPKTQYDKMKSEYNFVPEPMKQTPALPEEWPRSGGIPASATLKQTISDLKPGELHLDQSMTKFLSNVLPSKVANAPVGLMNLFKYPQGDSSIHDSYMEGFKNNFGDAAGASIKFMGPVSSELKYEGDKVESASTGDISWQDANLVQYDTIWHYAYMLSTDVYKELNKQKIAGLEDTCILCVSEFELA